MFFNSLLYFRQLTTESANTSAPFAERHWWRTNVWSLTAGSFTASRLSGKERKADQLLTSATTPPLFNLPSWWHHQQTFFKSCFARSVRFCVTTIVFLQCLKRFLLPRKDKRYQGYKLKNSPNNQILTNEPLLPNPNGSTSVFAVLVFYDFSAIPWFSANLPIAMHVWQAFTAQKFILFIVKHVNLCLNVPCICRYVF